MILEELTLILNLNQWKLWSLKSRIIWLLSKFGIKPKICRFKQNYPQQSLTSHKIQTDGDCKWLFNLRCDPAGETFVAFVWPPETATAPPDADWMLGNSDPRCSRNTRAILLHAEREGMSISDKPIIRGNKPAEQIADETAPSCQLTNWVPHCL